MTDTHENNFVTFTEALERFRPFDKNAFTYRVRKGEILTKEIHSQTRYDLQSTISVRNRLLKKSSRRDALPETSIDWLTADDILAALNLDKLVYDEYFLGEAIIYQDWKKKNPHTSLAVYDREDRRICYAYIGLIPLPESTIIDILTGKRDEMSLRESDLLSYDQPGEYNLLANSAVHHPNYPEFINSLLRKMMDFWVSMYPEQRIKRIYAQAVTDDGRIMAKKLYLGPLYRIADDHAEHIKDAFVVDMDEPSPSKIIREFQARLKDKENH